MVVYVAAVRTPSTLSVVDNLHGFAQRTCPLENDLGQSVGARAIFCDLMKQHLRQRSQVIRFVLKVITGQQPGRRRG